MKKYKKRMIIIGILLVVLILICDMRLKTVVYTVESDKVEAPVRIALITDLHSDWYGRQQHTLIDAVDEAKPDVVLLGGDIFDDEKSYENGKAALQHLAEKYTCYYVTGNHEYWSGDIATILDMINGYGITILSGEYDTVEVNGQTIQIGGVDDPDVLVYTNSDKSMLQQMTGLDEAMEETHFKLLLSHRPEYYDIYQKHTFDLVLCGHAHGGQWRIPGILNGLFAPDQGLFPKYAGGRYDYENGTMIVSRGLARESTPVPRIFNRPELVIVDVR